MKDNNLVGVLLVDKASGMTSHDVVDRVRKAAGMRRVGHTGTLDPAATGLLVICLGPATRLSEHLTGLDKVYEGDLRFGVTTDSYDMDGTVLEERPVPELNEAKIQSAFDEYVGDIEQVPPMVSAVKVGGERLYKLARRGETVERKARNVTVHEFTLLNYDAPLARFRVTCTSGTYVRALCHDVGEQLGCGAALNSLRRTGVGRHHVENAIPVDLLRSVDDVVSRLLPLGEVLDLPTLVVRPAGERLIRNGGALSRVEMMEECPVSSGWVQIKSARGDLLALGEVETVPGAVRVRPKRVLVGPLA